MFPSHFIGCPKYHVKEENVGILSHLCANFFLTADLVKYIFEAEHLQLTATNVVDSSQISSLGRGNSALQILQWWK